MIEPKHVVEVARVLYKNTNHLLILTQNGSNHYGPEGSIFKSPRILVQ